jgi:hypothetical protein
MMRCEGAVIWGKETLDKRFRNVYAAVVIRRVRCMKSTGSTKE